MTLVTSNPFSVRVRPRGAPVASFQLSSPTGGTNLPYSLGHAFKQGAVPANVQLIADIGALQVSGKNWWPDGSLKFAVVAGRADLVANAARTVTLSLGTPLASPNLTTADLRASGVTAATSADAFGTASWAGADWDAPFHSWISGPQMSSWVYRKPIGSDAHLVAWLEVRLFLGGAVEVLPWVENGYLNVAGPTNKNAQYAFTLGATERFRASFDLANHCRTVLIAGARFSYWLGADPQALATPGKAYLQATHLVPAYGASVPDTANVLATTSQTYTPLQQGKFSAAMGMTGFAPAIGLLPEWDVVYLTSNAAAAYAGVITHGYGAGRYGIHFRDEKTQRPLLFSSYPNLAVNSGGSNGIADVGGSSKNIVTPLSQGTVPPTWDTPHHPSIGFMAYLVTGRFYFMEEAQFSATVGFLK
ncbi:MAG: hypothetical protein QFF03_00315, partial [Pseudomonadota bacterium]|nr:hypothetical protein [Pseudomonadota bacterium]